MPAAPTRSSPGRSAADRPRVAAGTTTTTSRAMAASIARDASTCVRSTGTVTAITRAPPDTASRMPPATSRARVVPSVPAVTRIGRMVASGAMPTKRLPGCSWAAMRPATAVPCPRQPSAPAAAPGTAFSPASTRPLSAGAVASTPVSTTATVMPPPRPWVQALVGANRNWAQGTPLDGPDAGTAHSGSTGSVGTGADGAAAGRFTGSSP
ncbi:hypothetical protein GCM10027605_34050 [Micromonospora zhanjiangensis]